MGLERHIGANLMQKCGLRCEGSGEPLQSLKLSKGDSVGVNGTLPCETGNENTCCTGFQKQGREGL